LDSDFQEVLKILRNINDEQDTLEVLHCIDSTVGQIDQEFGRSNTQDTNSTDHKGSNISKNLSPDNYCINIQSPSSNLFFR